MDDIFCSFIIGIITGVISGWITGILITKYYRKKDEELQERDKHDYALSLAVDFFEDLQIEISRVKEIGNNYYSKILSIFDRKQRYLQKLCHGKYALDVKTYEALMDKIWDIEKKFKNNTIDFERDDRKIQELYLSAFEILGPCK